MENSNMHLDNNFGISSFLDFQELTDGKLKTEDGHSFNIHKIELAKRNKYFYRLFCGFGKGKKEYLIPGIKGEVLANILAYIYTGNIFIAEASVCDLLIAAGVLLCDDLVRDISKKHAKFILSILNCLPLFLTALKINQEDILYDSHRFIQTNFETVVLTESSNIGELPLDTFKHFLSDRNLCVRDENSVWLAIVKWIQLDVTNRQHLLPDLLLYLSPSEIDEQLSATIIKHEIVSQNPYCADLNNIKSSNSSKSALEILLAYIQSHSKPLQFLHHQRSPNHLYFIAHYCVHNQTDGLHIYVTYDGNIDLWRKVTEIEISPDLIFSIDHDLYLMRTAINATVFRYNLIRKEWSRIVNSSIERNYYNVVQLQGSIYMLGGVSIQTDNESNAVESYDPRTEIWSNASPMIPVTSFNAVAFENRIFAVGVSPEFTGDEMVAQTYDAELNEWILLPSPRVFRYNFALVSYHGWLYVLGGRNGEEYLRDVEVFDPTRKEWKAHKLLPYSYYLTKAIVLNNRLIVYDSHDKDRSYLVTNPAVEWDEELGDWRSFKKSSAMNAVYKYAFILLESRECINRISNESKDPSINFVKSPFS